MKKKKGFGVWLCCHTSLQQQHRRRNGNLYKHLTAAMYFELIETTIYHVVRVCAAVQKQTESVFHLRPKRHPNAEGQIRVKGKAKAGDLLMKNRAKFSQQPCHQTPLRKAGLLMYTRVKPSTTTQQLSDEIGSIFKDFLVSIHSCPPHTTEGESGWGV